MVVRLLMIVFSSCIIGVLTYVGCVFWPLQLLKPTALIAAISVALGWAITLAVYFDSRNSSIKP